jgi:hypothetical protein
MDIFDLRKTGFCATGFINLKARRMARGGGDRSKAISPVSAIQPGMRADTRRNFFIWIPRNSLKRPESAKGIQGNPSLFIWNHLVLLGFICTELALRLC